MTWRVYELRYEAQSPIMVGDRVIGFVRKCRPYVPARTLWGAVIAGLAHASWQDGDSANQKYETVTQALERCFRPGYLFVADEVWRPLLPDYQSGALRYGSLSAAEFERKYIGASGMTAIAPFSFSAESGTLHESEYLDRTPKGQNGPLRLVGRVLIKENEGAKKVREALRNLQLGGGRTAGFGRVRLLPRYPLFIDDNRFFRGWKLRVCSDSPSLERGESDDPALAHVLLPKNFKGRVQGDIELMIGLEHSTKDGPGQEVINEFDYPVALPGSIISLGEGEYHITVGNKGFWKVRANGSSALKNAVQAVASKGIDV